MESLITVAPAFCLAIPPAFQLRRPRTRRPARSGSGRQVRASCRGCYGAHPGSSRRARSKCRNRDCPGIPTVMSFPGAVSGSRRQRCDMRTIRQDGLPGLGTDVSGVWREESYTTSFPFAASTGQRVSSSDFAANGPAGSDFRKSGFRPRGKAEGPPLQVPEGTLAYNALKVRSDSCELKEFRLCRHKDLRSSCSGRRP
jgi:hypothetical protein